MNLLLLKRAIVCGVVLALLVGSLPVECAEVKSPRKAALLSLLLPGAGELYAGGGRSGRFFLFVEGASWTGLFAFKALESGRESTFKSFAAAHAGARTDGKPESYFDDLVLYQSIYDRNARAVFLDGDLAVLTPRTPENTWEWDSATSRRKFQALRAKATSARQKSLLFVGALVFNRFASAINAAHIARKTGPVAPRTIQTGLAPRTDGGVQAFLRAKF